MYNINTISNNLFQINCPKETAANKIVEIFCESLEAKDSNTTIASTNIGSATHTFLCTLPIVKLANLKVKKVTATQAKGGKLPLVQIKLRIEQLRKELKEQNGWQRKVRERDIKRLGRLYRKSGEKIDLTQNFKFILEWDEPGREKTHSIFPISPQLAKKASVYAQKEKDSFSYDPTKFILNFMLAFNTQTPEGETQNFTPFSSPEKDKDKKPAQERITHPPKGAKVLFKPESDNPEEVPRRIVTISRAIGYVEWFQSLADEKEEAD